MAGLSRTDGTALDDLEHIQQSVDDILGTAIGTRSHRRDYGSEVPDLIDQPMIATNILRLYAATAVALARWEDRIRLRRVSLIAGEHPGAATLIMDAERTGTSPGMSGIRLTTPLPF